MTTALPSHYNAAPFLQSYSSHIQQQPQKRRVLLKRATQQINDPEVIKQLKQQQPKKKSVQFLPDDQLTQVRYFYKSHSPSTCRHGDPPFMSCSTNDFKLTLPNWPTRNTLLYTTDQKIRMESISLIEGDYQDMKQNKMMMEGRCRALNLNFYKLVTIRYTFDLWRTYQETTCEFKESIASTSNTWDRFSFHIPVDAINKTQSVYLALRYTVDQQEYWDNNHGMNYQVIVTPEPGSFVVQEMEEKEQQLQGQEEEATLQEATITTTRTKEDEEELVMLKENIKVLGKRYDFSASLTAATTKYIKPFFISPPPSPPGTPIDTESFIYTPPVFFGSSVSSSDMTTTSCASSVAQYTKSEPISINISKQQSSVEGFQMSYSDFVNKYCFYNSHSNPIYSTLSTSPSAVLS